MKVSCINQSRIFLFPLSLFFLLSQAPVLVTEDVQTNQMTSTTSAPGSPQEAVEVRTENLFQRTEVLAGVYHMSPMMLNHLLQPLDQSFYVFFFNNSSSLHHIYLLIPEKAAESDSQSVNP